MTKEIKVYSKLHELPRGQASEQITQGCIVLEGGAFRGLYTSGVLDALMEADINMQTTIGVSAGALNGFNYTSGDIGRFAFFNLYYRHDSRWVGMRALRQSHSVTGFHFLFEEGDKMLPYNKERFFHAGRRFVAVATNLNTGMPTYFDQTHPQIFDAVSASASMPFVSKKIMIDGDPYLDGGCSVKIPIDWALEQNFDKIIVVTTRDRSYRRKEKADGERLLHAMYRAYPAFIDAMAHTNAHYNETCDRMEQLDKDGRIFWIAPSRPVTVSRLEGDMEKLGELYFEGYEDAKAIIPQLKAYLAGSPQGSAAAE